MRSLLTLAAFTLLPSIAAAQSYHYTVNQPASTLSYNIAFSAPFQITPGGSSYIIGTRAGADAIPGNADDIVAPAPGSRTIPGLFGGDTNGNAIINLTSGSISATGNSGATVIHPAGAFDVSFNTGAGTASISNLSSSLLGGGSATIAANATIGYSSFREREPTCTIISIGAITVPVGDITATSITATQNASSATGTLTPIGGQPGHYTFSVQVPAVITVAATLAGAPAPLDPQAVTLTVSGSVDLTQASAPVTGQIVVNQTQTAPDPIAMDPFTFTEPLCSGTLAIKLTLASTSTTIGVTANLSATGATSVCPADLGTAGGLPGADGHLDNNDFIAFINHFFNSNPLADRGVAGGLPGHDGQFDNNDFIAFINQFFAGC